ncbi:protein-L-isoaspartate O-methyltransferase [Aurantimonas sp. Leaf443]|uniref:protein-L-isoaspartate O-methyltransferase family protein n=1 Tax=Aurantimonas sp. Leaf443 TaxID=1736378 RepID=UPI0006F6B3F0|nr:protein-L-isoaspartate O-methyltransferase [Aurantimonas sp. Leaf443]KQT88495.1 protein-L-isoaspartate O-methyltransferase [Aurantimonas sp. Leaf443]
MDFVSARQKMVDNQIRTVDVTGHAILRAFLTVPRERFVPEERKALSYIDEDLPLGGGRYLMEAAPFAKLLQLAEIRPTDAILDVASANGYSAAILSHLGARVVALEEDEALAAEARQHLADLSIGNCEVVTGPLEAGAPAKGPFDVILFEGAVERLPQALFAQLARNGRLVAVEGHGNAALAKIHVKDGEDRVSARSAFNCAIPAIPGFRRKAEFVF